MKSIIQESSSVAKAIELALAQAANPKDFSVKVLEYPTKNFFGITTRPARIALYWDDKTTQKTNDPHPIPTLENTTEARSGERPERRGERNTQERPARQEQRREPHARPERREPREQRNEQRETREMREPQERREREFKEVREPREHKEQIAAPEPEQEQSQNVEEVRVPLWNTEMVDYSKRWLQRVLTGLQREIPFTMEPHQFYLRITFTQPLFDDADQERKVLASLSLLLLETCRHTFKVNLRGHKVLLTHAPSSASSQ
jgi:hypothetical protein